jgi:hypothetical protein
VKVAAPLTSGLLDACCDRRSATCSMPRRDLATLSSTPSRREEKQIRGQQRRLAHTAQTSSERRAELPERQGYRTASECSTHWRTDSRNQPLAPPVVSPNDEPSFAARTVAVTFSIH